MKKKIDIGVTLFIVLCVSMNVNKLLITSGRNIKDSKIKTDKQLAIYVIDNNGEYMPSTITSFPKKEDGYIFKEGVCTNGGVVTQNEDESFNISVSSTDQCKLYFDKTLVRTLLDKANGDGINDYNDELGNKGEMYTFKHEATEQTGALTDYRYIGSSPNNWIKFNNEDWRIIGVFEVDGEQRVKIMRNESIGNMSWNEKGTNDWVNSTLNSYLNGDYYNGLSVTARNQVASSTWYLGGSNFSQLNGEAYYNFERGKTVYSGRSIKTTGNVGLIYPSDYIYTYADKVDEICYDSGNSCEESTGKINGWIYNDIFNKQFNWLLSTDTEYSDRTFYIHPTGYVRIHGYDGVRDTYGVNSTVYLKSDIKFVGGNGGGLNPYTLS